MRNATRTGKRIASRHYHNMPAHKKTRAEEIDDEPHYKDGSPYQTLKAKVARMVKQTAQKDFHGRISCTYGAIGEGLAEREKEHLSDVLNDLRSDRFLRWSVNDPAPSRIYLEGK